MHLISGAYILSLEFEPFTVDGRVALSRHGASFPRKDLPCDMPPPVGMLKLRQTYGTVLLACAASCVVRLGAVFKYTLYRLYESFMNKLLSWLHSKFSNVDVIVIL
jgi:hypothetical protein